MQVQGQLQHRPWGRGVCSIQQLQPGLHDLLDVLRDCHPIICVEAPKPTLTMEIMYSGVQLAMQGKVLPEGPISRLV